MPDFIIVNWPLNVGNCLVFDEFIKTHVVFFKITQSFHLHFLLLFTLKLRVELFILGATHEVINIIFYHFVHDHQLLLLVFLLVSFLSSSRFTLLTQTVLIFGNFVRFFNNAVNFASEKLFFWWSVLNVTFHRRREGPAKWMIERTWISLDFPCKWRASGSAFGVSRSAGSIFIDQRQRIFDFAF